MSEIAEWSIQKLGVLALVGVLEDGKDGCKEERMNGGLRCSSFSTTSSAGIKYSQAPWLRSYDGCYCASKLWLLLLWLISSPFQFLTIVTTSLFGAVATGDNTKEVWCGLSFLLCVSGVTWMEGYQGLVGWQGWMDGWT